MDVVLELNEEDLSYEFNDLLIVKEDGKYWFINDSGCSCPGRLENASFPTDFEVLNSKTFNNFLNAVSTFPAGVLEKQSFINSAAKLIQEK